MQSLDDIGRIASEELIDIEPVLERLDLGAWFEAQSGRERVDTEQAGHIFRFV